MNRLTALLLGCIALAGCAAPTDGDGEVPTSLTPAVEATSATQVVVDTDLGGDDLVALAFLLRHPQVHVDAITIAATGLVGCDPGVDLVADLLTALGEEPVDVACGRAGPGRDGLALPGRLAGCRRGGQRPSAVGFDTDRELKDRAGVDR